MCESDFKLSFQGEWRSCRGGAIHSLARVKCLLSLLASFMSNLLWLLCLPHGDGRSTGGSKRVGVSVDLVQVGKTADRIKLARQSPVL